MHKHKSIVLAVAAIMVGVPLISHAAGITPSFGGRVLTTKIPSVTCYGTGTGPVLLVSNLSAARSTLQGGSVSNIVTSAYGVIPFYTTSANKTPKPGGWILGTHQMIPNFSTCTIGSFPFPVKKTTNNYGVSGGTGGNPFGQ
jgi:hypothetical protein